MSEQTFPAYVGPLRVVEPAEFRSHSPALTPEGALIGLCTPGLPGDLTAILGRYDEIDIEKNLLFVVPHEAEIMNKIVWPLRHAKVSYMLGNYLGAISLCGTVAEMLTILLFDTSDFSINNRPMDGRAQAELFGSAFENLGQDRRVKVLRAYGIVTDADAARFDDIRRIRKRYLHLWSQSHEAVAQDAVACFLAAVRLVAEHVIALGPDSKFVLSPRIHRYLKQRGLLNSAPGPA